MALDTLLHHEWKSNGRVSVGLESEDRGCGYIGVVFEKQEGCYIRCNVNSYHPVILRAFEFGDAEDIPLALDLNGDYAVVASSAHGLYLDHARVYIRPKFLSHSPGFDIAVRGEPGVRFVCDEPFDSDGERERMLMGRGLMVGLCLVVSAEK